MIISNFAGIDNTGFQEMLEPNKLVEADNIVIPGGGGVASRPGIRLITTDEIVSSFGISSQEFIVYINSGGFVSLYNGDYTTVLGSVETGVSYLWVEETPKTLLLLLPSGVYRVKKDVLLQKLENIPPPGLEDVVRVVDYTEMSVSAYIMDSVCVGKVVGILESIIHIGLPGYPGLRSIEDDWFTIPDEVTWIEAFGSELLILCKKSIYSVDVNNKIMKKLLDYGCPGGRVLSKLNTMEALIWSTRGVVHYPTMENKTIGTFLAPPGIISNTTVMQYDGAEYFIVCSDGASISYDVQK